MNISTLNDYNLPHEYIDKLRAFLRLTTNEDDDLIKLLFSSAVDYAEKKLSIVIGKKDFSMKTHIRDAISLPKIGFPVVTAVKIAENNIEFEQKDYIVKILNPELTGLCEVFFTIDGGKCRDSLMMAIFSHVFFLYENRGMIQNGQQSGQASFETAQVQNLYAPFIENNFNI